MTKAKVFIRYAIVYLAFLILSCYMANYGDDFVFKAGIERYGSFFGWVNFFARMWGGRIVPQGILVLLLQLPEIVFHLFDAFAWVLLLIYIKKVFDADEMLPFWFVCCAVSIMIFVLIPISVLTGSVLWKCANVLYLWGSAGILVGIYPLIRQLNDRAVRKRDMVFSTIAIVYTSSFEQAAALLCGACALLLFFVVLNKKNVRWSIVFLFVLSLACSLFFAMLPGNKVRYQAEVLGQIQNYDMYTFVDKVLWGIWYAISGVENDAMFLLLLLVVTLAFIMYKTRKPTDPVLIGLLTVLGYFILCTLNHIGISNGGSSYFISDLFSLIQVDTTQFGISPLTGFRSIIHFMAYVYLGCCIMLIDPKRFRPVGFTFYFGALATMLVMGFSPTIYASKSRPRFICYLFFINVEIGMISVAASMMREEGRSILDIFHKYSKKQASIGMISFDGKKDRSGIIALLIGVCCVACVLISVFVERNPKAFHAEWQSVGNEASAPLASGRWLYSRVDGSQRALQVLTPGEDESQQSASEPSGLDQKEVEGMSIMTVPDRYWIAVCDEQHDFTAKTSMIYRYGSEGHYCYKLLNEGSYTASHALFDVDPLFAENARVYRLSIPDKYWLKVADADEQFSCAAGLYRYGDDFNWNYAFLSQGTYTASNTDAFGADTIPHDGKSVYRLNIR